MYPKKMKHRVVCEPDYPVAETRSGKLRGLLKDGCFIFRGVEYASARRFHAPEDPAGWEGIRPALVYGPVPDEISTRIPGDAFTEPHFWYPQSEHCQNLNIWTPSIDPSSRLPVMVWIHGGGQEHGSAVEIMAYDGEELAVWGNVVIVSVNHRLNALGYLSLASFGEEYRDSGYAGMLDLIASLKWIRDNIVSFGGDPDNVMLFGQSGGGFKIIQLMQMPEADGLYHKVSIHSGTGRETVFTEDNAAQTAEDVVSCLGLDRDSISEIETVPYFRLAKAVNYAYERFLSRTGKRLQWTPPVDSVRFMGNPQMDPVRFRFRNETAGIPVMAGSVLGEFCGSAALNNETGDINTWDLYTETSFLLEKYGDYAGEIVREFKKAYPEKTLGHALDVDVFIRKPTIDLCRMRAGAGFAPVWNWLLSLDMPCYGGSTSWHNADEAYIFHHAEYFESEYIPGVSEHLQDQMAGALVYFAYNSDPNGPGLPEWAPVSEKEFPTMIFDRKTEVRYDHDSLLVELVEKAGGSGPGGKGPVRLYGGGPRAHI